MTKDFNNRILLQGIRSYNGHKILKVIRKNIKYIYKYLHFALCYLRNMGLSFDWYHPLSLEQCALF